jgi:hypothetical protein
VVPTAAEGLHQHRRVRAASETELGRASCCVPRRGDALARSASGGLPRSARARATPGVTAHRRGHTPAVAATGAGRGWPPVRAGSSGGWRRWAQLWVRARARCGLGAAANRRVRAPAVRTGAWRGQPPTRAPAVRTGAWRGQPPTRRRTSTGVDPGKYPHTHRSRHGGRPWTSTAPSALVRQLAVACARRSLFPPRRYRRRRTSVFFLERSCLLLNAFLGSQKMSLQLRGRCSAVLRRRARGAWICADYAWSGKVFFFMVRFVLVFSSFDRSWFT